MKAVPIVIVSGNGLAQTRRCIESIMAYSHYEFSLPYSVIVVDNASRDGTRKYLRDLYQLPSPYDPGYILIYSIRNERDLGRVKGLNMGITLALEAEPEYIGLGTTDIMIPGDPWWLDRLLGPFKKEDVGAVGPTSNSIRGLQRHEYSQELPDLHEAPLLAGVFMIARADVLREVGLLDQDPSMRGNEYVDLSIRIRQAGYKLMVNRTSFIYHGRPTGKAPSKAPLIEKWGEEMVERLFRGALERREG